MKHSFAVAVAHSTRRAACRVWWLQTPGGEHETLQRNARVWGTFKFGSENHGPAKRAPAVTCRTLPESTGPLFAMHYGTPPVEVYVSGSSPPCACLFGGQIGGCLQTNQAKPPPAGFGGSMRRSHAIKKNMPFFTFFYVQPKYQNGAIFVNIKQSKTYRRFAAMFEQAELRGIPMSPNGPPNAKETA